MRHKLERNAGRLCRRPMCLIYLGAVCLLFCLNVVTSGRDGEMDEAKFRRKLLAPALKMLKAEGVPFDPKLLLGDDWRSQLEPALARMPSMGETVRVTEPMKGVYLAGTLLLPEHVSLKGDTVILTRELAPDDENSVISITGDYQLFIFNIGDSKKFAAMLRNRSRGQFLNINVEAPCAVVGIAPIYRGRTRCRGMAIRSGGMSRD
jgi:hypothetical protein